jgi:very-short-patch-repair endonuclease
VAAERAIAHRAARQHGIVTTAQLEAAGFSGTQLTRRVAGGWLARLHVGVYRLGVFGGPFADEMAALLACGPRAALGRWTSISVFGLAPRPSHVHVVLEGAAGGRRSGVRSHRTARLPACDVVIRYGLRVTTPARTLLDLAAVTRRDVLERLVEEVMVQRLASNSELHAVIGRGTGRPGVRKLRDIVDFLDEPLFTRSEAEKRLRELVRSAGLPQPRMNVHRAGWEVDAVWDEQRLVVEVDGRKFHSTPARFERDRRKDADLLLAGHRVLRVTWRRLTKEPRQVVAILAAALALGDDERARRR